MIHAEEGVRAFDASRIRRLVEARSVGGLIILFSAIALGASGAALAALRRYGDLLLREDRRTELENLKTVDVAGRRIDLPCDERENHYLLFVSARCLQCKDVLTHLGQQQAIRDRLAVVIDSEDPSYIDYLHNTVARFDIFSDTSGELRRVFKVKFSPSLALYRCPPAPVGELEIGMVSIVERLGAILERSTNG